MQPYTLPKIKLLEYIEPEIALAETPFVEESRPKRCSLDSLPLELLREIVKQVAPRSLFGTQRTLARLVMVNKQLRYLLLADAHKTMWVNSAEKIGPAADLLPQGIFASVETLIVTQAQTEFRLSGFKPSRTLLGVRNLEFAQLCDKLPMLRSLRLRDLDRWPLEAEGVWNRHHAFPLDSSALCGLSSIAIKDAVVMAEDASYPSLRCEHFSLCGETCWESGLQDSADPERFLSSEPTRFPQLRTLRLGLLHVPSPRILRPPRLLELPLTLPKRLEAIQLDLDRKTRFPLTAGVPACYFACGLPVLFNVSQASLEWLEQSTREVNRFQYVEIVQTCRSTISELCSRLSSSTELRALFYSTSLLHLEEVYLSSRLRNLLNTLEEKGIDVVACEPDDDDDLILPEFLDYLKKRKEVGHA